MLIKSIISIAWLLILLLAGQIISAEDEPPIVTEGSRIRIHFDTTVTQKLMPNTYHRIKKTQKLSGMLTSVANDSITITDCRLENGVYQRPISDLKKLEISSGRKDAALKGLLIGAGSGALLGMIVGYMPGESPFRGDVIINKSHFSLESTLTGAVGGAFLGAFFGSLIKEDHWREVDHRQWPGQVRVGINPIDPGIDLSLRF